MDYGVNCNRMDGEFKGNVLILEAGKIVSHVGHLFYIIIKYTVMLKYKLRLPCLVII